MTWGEFKESVELAGITDADKIGYIDISYPQQIRIEEVDEECASPKMFNVW